MNDMHGIRLVAAWAALAAFGGLVSYGAMLCIIALADALLGAL